MTAKNKTALLKALKKILLRRPSHTFPEPSDLVKELKKAGFSVSSAELVELVLDEISTVRSESKEPDFMVRKVYGYDSIHLTDHGREIRKTDLNAEKKRLDKITKSGINEKGPENLKNLKPTKLRLAGLDAYEFEKLIEQLLRGMGASDVVTTRKSGDGGIDVRATMTFADMINISLALQVKKYKDKSVGAPTVRELRGSLALGEVGCMVTLSHFTKEAWREAELPDRQSITLIDGDKLLKLLDEHNIKI